MSLDKDVFKTILIFPKQGGLEIYVESSQFDEIPVFNLGQGFFGKNTLIEHF